MINVNLIPVTYTIGSMGASGDLAPLAHVALTLIGEVDIWVDDQQKPSKEVLAQHNLKSTE